MLIPIVCFSCGQCIAHLYQTYLDLVQFYREKPEELNNYRQNAMKLDDKIITSLPQITPEEAALYDLGVKRMCCRRMFLTQCDTYNLMNIDNIPKNRSQSSPSVSTNSVLNKQPKQPKQQNQPKRYKTIDELLKSSTQAME